jgi:hypothetical protein
MMIALANAGLATKGEQRYQARCEVRTAGE